MTNATIGRRDNGRIVKNLLILYATQFVTMLLSLAPLAFLPVYLGDVGMGRLSFAYAFTHVFGTLMILGTASYIVREIARDHARLSEIVLGAAALRIALATGLLPIAAAVLYSMGFAADLRMAVLILYGSVVIRSVSAAFASALQALENMLWRSIASITWEAVAAIAGWLVLREGGGVIGYLLVILLANSLELLINVSYFVLVLPIRFTIRWHAVAQVFRGGLPFFAWVFVQALYMQSSNLFLMQLGGEVAAGWMGTASRFVVPLFAIPTVAITVLLPRFSQLHAMDPESFRQAVARSLSYMTVITMPVAVGISVIAGRVIDLFNYPATFQNSIPVLRILAFTLPGTSLLMVMATAVSAMKVERAWSKISLFSLVMVLLLNSALIPLARTYLDNPAIGAAAAFLGAELLTLGFALRRFGHATVDRTTVITVGKTGLAAAAMAVVVLAAAWSPLAIMIVLGGMVYVGAALLLKVLPPDDLRVVQSLVAGRLRRIAIALK